jgi:hypothetical protein
MILFYSNSCQHCSILLDTIKKHDTKKTIKLLCIDTIIGIIKHKITNVPALMFLPTKEVIYGKAVFDYLLLPNRGYLFTTNNTREKPQTSTNDKSSLNSPVPLNKENNPDEPSAFSLGSILTDNFSNITDDNINSLSINNDKLYRWDFIDNDNSSQVPLPPQPEMTDKKSSNTENRKLPSLEELTKEREKLFKDII